MKHKLAELLVDAEGRSEFAIVVVADIRGFSDFSTRNESPNIAMFIKRFYFQMLEKYFPSANFVKPTGDGLLMTFQYSERNLMEVARTVIDAAVKCVTEFPSICADDPMINFSVPGAIGFGVARGTACCLFSGEEVIDYSGHLLNLASRLNDLARPSGIVIDGSFLIDVIPEELRTSFGEQNVYLRGIAEDTPISVYYQKDFVTVPGSALSALSDETWSTKTVTFTVRQLSKLTSEYRVFLDKAPKDNTRVRVKMSFPKRGMKGVVVMPDITDFSIKQIGPQHLVALNMNTIRREVAKGNAAQNAKVTITVYYVAKPLPRT